MDIVDSFRRVSIWASAAVVAIAVTMFASSAAPSPAGIERADASTGRAALSTASAQVDPFAEAERTAKRERQRQREEREADLPEVSNAAGEPLSVTGACEENLAIAAKQGLTLPKGWAIHCVGPGLDWEGNSHWGVTCPYEACPEGAGPYVSISSPTYYVIAHELCHANFGNDEQMADSCAAEHGASLETSPYQ